ncbi:MAG: DHHW family protein [Saccharofermentanales bacterium]
MSEQHKSKIIAVGFMVLLLSGLMTHLFCPKESVSYSERRLMQQFPPLSASRLFSKEWTEKFELYTLDQFVLRDRFRQLKALLVFDVFRQMDNNKIYVIGQDVFKLEYRLDEESVRKASDRIDDIALNYFAGSKVFYALIPDKSMYADPATGYPILDYARLSGILEAETGSAVPISLYDELDADSYFRTDIHWKQEELLLVLDKLGHSLGFEPDNQYTEKTLAPFYGGYYGQSALNISPDELTYLYNDAILNGEATDRIKGEPLKIYNPDDFRSVDPYNVFLGGPVAVIDVINPVAEAKRELVIFRDSYASSLVPLMLPYYSRITLIDLRYVPYSKIPEFIKPAGQDVLFLYSALLANSSFLLR